ncbi:MAG: DUF192 domain-containing protein [Candidatus Altiarchaeota archaeon]|nr:DUF192 domain-containing protein [Candidatus Altiarchaeota archaeon]
MKVLNRGSGILLSGNAKLADSFLDRLIGLMFSKGKDLVIKASREGVMESSIHMMFMLQQIDVVWVDGKMRVAGVRKTVPPCSLFKPGTWKIYFPEKPALYVVELACGSAGETKVGDEIEFI